MAELKIGAPCAHAYSSRYLSLVAARPASAQLHQMVGGPNSHILIYYIERSRDEIYWVASAKGEWHSQASWEFCSQEEVINAFVGFHPEVRTVIETAPQLTTWPIMDVEPLDTWSKSRFGSTGGTPTMP
jgi:hypothetical protein